ncbi:MAG: hypothetical protein UR26_C0006G0003 [candidate division TM6 bacterium GW2011_GWF2_32_72]|nr:MAG: hypothetical protein UR26_C0006G0003 [candidate division TM6 bacterium GW2011_GWF2_32_72]
MRSIKFFFILGLLIKSQLWAPLFFSSRNNIIRVLPTGHLNIGQPITLYDGTLIKRPGGVISGETISFDYGFYEDVLGSAFLKAIYDPDVDGISLEGNSFLNGIAGTLLETVTISGVDNLIQGQPLFSNMIYMLDASTTVTLTLQSKLNQSIYLNGGTIYLGADLQFIPGTGIGGFGTINANGYSIILSGDLNFSSSVVINDASEFRLGGDSILTGLVTFNGNTVLNFNGNAALFSPVGIATIGPNSRITFKNGSFQHVQANNIICSAGSTLEFQGSSCYFDADFTFTSGSLLIRDMVTFVGTCTFVYQSVETSTILAESQLILDSGFTFSYDPLSTSDNLINFEDSSAQLVLNGGALRATETGIHLTKGTMVVQENSYISAASSADYAHGFVLGDATLANDFTINILGGRNLYFEYGNFVYNNESIYALNTQNPRTVLQIGDDCRLVLYNSMDIGSGQARFLYNTTLAAANNSILIGNVLPVGVINLENI